MQKQWKDTKQSREGVILCDVFEKIIKWDELPMNSTNDDILDVCCNTVVLDTELDIFRFTHLSVSDYFRSS